MTLVDFERDAREVIAGAPGLDALKGNFFSTARTADFYRVTLTGYIPAENWQRLIVEIDAAALARIPIAISIDSPRSSIKGAGQAAERLHAMAQRMFAFVWARECVGPAVLVFAAGNERSMHPGGRLSFGGLHNPLDGWDGVIQCETHRQFVAEANRAVAAMGLPLPWGGDWTVTAEHAEARGWAAIAEDVEQTKAFRELVGWSARTKS